MKLEKWALIAEIISGVAVVTTLIFLVLGVRENTGVVRASAYDRNLQSLIDWRTSIREDSDSVRVFTRYFLERNRDESGLSNEDLSRLRLMLNELWGVYEKTYFSWQYGLLGEPEWSRFVGRICTQYLDDLDGWQSARTFLTDDFSRYVTSTCDDRAE